MSGRRPNDHAAFRLLAAAAVDGWIDPLDAADLEAHLTMCPACRADQQAMLADRTWLATPAGAMSPDLRIRTFVLRAARSPRVPRTSDARRQWMVLASAALAVSVVGGGLLAARFVPPIGATPSSSNVAATFSFKPRFTATAYPYAAPTDGIPFVRFTGQATGRGETIGELDLVVFVQGSGIEAQGTVEISRNGEVAWSGTILSATYWNGAYGTDPHWVAHIEGCVTGLNPCQRYTLQLFDGGASRLHTDDVRFWMPMPGATDPPDATRVYRVVAGDVVIGGSMLPG